MHHSISHWIHDIWYYYLRTMAINRDKLNLVVTVKFNIGDFLPYKYKFCWTKPFFSKGISVCLGLFFNSSDQNYHILATAQNRLIIFNFKSLPNAICKVILCFYFLSRYEFFYAFLNNCTPPTKTHENSSCSVSLSEWYSAHIRFNSSTWIRSKDDFL